MNDEREIEIPGDAVPDDIDNYLAIIPQMKVRARIEKANSYFSQYSFFTWSDNDSSVLREDQRVKITDLLNTANHVSFSCMSLQLKQVLWKGVRFYYGLSEQEFPFPDSLKDNLGSVTSKKLRNALPLAGVIALIVFSSFVGALIGNTVGKIQSRPDSSYPSDVSLLSSAPSPILGRAGAATAQSAVAEPIPKFIPKASQSQQ